MDMLTSLVLGLTATLTAPSPPPAASLAAHPPVQVNVDGFGRNIPGDAANEPSLAVDRAAPNRLVVAWRQFASLDGAVRTAGWATSNDGGRTWTFHGSIGGEVFRTDPVVAAAGDGRFMHYGLAEGYTSADLFRSVDAGETWLGPVTAYGGDKPWMTVDPAIGHVYAGWSDSIGCCEDRVFTRSTDGGVSFSDPVAIGPTPVWGSMTVGLDGEQNVFVVRIGSYDCDRDGIDDTAAIADGLVSDCDHDQIPDACEIAAGAEADTDHDGVPDSCRLPAPRRAPRRVAP
jgi:hypothetical protein